MKGPAVGEHGDRASIPPDRPVVYLRDLRARISVRPIRDLAQFLSNRWKTARSPKNLQNDATDSTIATTFQYPGKRTFE